LRWAQAGKGGAEVVVTAALIYVLTTSSHANLQRTLDEAGRARTELQLLHRVLRHNLRNNLTLVLGNARRLRTDLEDPSRRAVCGEVITAAQEMEHWTEEAGKIRRATAGTDPVELDLVEAIPAVVDTEERIDPEAVETVMPETAPVRVSPQFELALEELVCNSLEHAGRADAGDGPAVRVVVSTQGARTIVEVSDDAPGFPEPVLAAVNDGGEDDLVHLDGLGLWLAYLVAAGSDGDLVLENEPDGAAARITVPAA